MFSKGFGNALGDDILSSIITETAKTTSTRKPTKFTDDDERHLEETRREIERLEKEMNNPSSIKSPTTKTTSGFGSSNIIKKNPNEKKQTANDTGVDDLLDFIAEAKGDKPLTATKKVSEPVTASFGGTSFNKPPAPMTMSMSTANKPLSQPAAKTNTFAAEFSSSDDDLGNVGYDPTVREPSNKRSSIGSNDVTQRKSALFGLSNASQAPANKSSGSEFGGTSTLPKPVQRPQTMETKIQRDDEDDFSINIGNSRRTGKTAGGNQAGTTKDRPFTSPGDLKSPEKKYGGNIGEEDEEDEVQSEYLNTIVSRGGDKKELKKPLVAGFQQGNTSLATGLKKNPLLGDAASPMRSPKADFSLSKDGYFANKEVTTSLLVEEKKEITRSPVGILGKKEYQEPSHQQGQVKSVASISNTGLRKEGATGNSQLSNASAFAQFEGLKGSHEAMAAEIGRDGVFQQYLRETEEHYRRRSKEAEEYYENRFKQLKNALEEEKRKWEEIHDKEVRLVKKENEELKDNMNRQLERERERVKEMMQLEMDSREKIHRYEIERQRKMFEDENESLKKQLEAQAKLHILADDIKQSSNKLFSISDKMEQERDVGSFGRKGELRDKEKQLYDLEKQLRHELEMVKDEKKRLDRLRNELETREVEDKEDIQKEKEFLRQEYSRLNELQEALRRQELDKMRGLEKQKVNYEHERSKTEKEAGRMKDEYRQKYHELEVQVELHELRAKEFEKFMEKTDANFSQKAQEMEVQMKKIVMIETELLTRLKELELKELLVHKSGAEVEGRLHILDVERINFEKERREVLKVAEQAREDGDKMKQFKQEFEVEQKKNQKLKIELAAFATNVYKERSKLNEEKSNMAMIQKNVEDMRHQYVREVNSGVQNTGMTLKPTNTNVIRIEPRREDSPGVRIPSATHQGFYSSSLVTSPHRDFGGVHKNQRNGSLAPQEDPRYVKFTDLKPENFEFRRSVKQENYTKKANGAIKIVSHEDHRSNIENMRSWQKNITAPVLEATAGYAGTSKTPIVDTFNYKNYMKQLNEYDKVSNHNQGYTDIEKEELVKTKLERSLHTSPVRRKSRGYLDF